MTRDQVTQLLHILKARNITQMEEWVKCSCLFALHNHASGRDGNPSAGVSIHHKSSVFNCYSCGTKMFIDDMLFELLRLNRAKGIVAPEVSKAMDYLSDLENDVATFEGMDYEEVLEPKKMFYDFTDTWLENFSSVFKFPKAMDYLHTRKGGAVPDQVIKDFDLRYDQPKQMIGFPYRESSNNMVAGMRGRSVSIEVNTDDSKKAARHYDYSYAGHNNSALIWYRANKLDATKPLIVVEGEFDCARVYQQYRNVTALLTAYASDSKLNYLCQFTAGVLWFSDADNAGEQSRKKARQYFESNKIEFNDLVVPEGLLQDDGKSVKDPGATPAKYLKYVMNEFVDLDDLIV